MNTETIAAIREVQELKKNPNNPNKKKYRNFSELMEDNMKTGQLIYDPTSDRYVIDGEELHCGDVLKVLVVNGLSGKEEWIETRIELDANDEWYLVGLVGYQIDGLFARA